MEVIVVDGGSADRTLAVSKQLKAKVATWQLSKKAVEILALAGSCLSCCMYRC